MNDLRKCRICKSNEINDNKTICIKCKYRIRNFLYLGRILGYPIEELKPVLDEIINSKTKNV
jgi:hypothetical protein